MTKEISGALYGTMCRLGAARLQANRKVINDLNVFPIPDGDTGDNMYMTIQAGCENASAEGTLQNIADQISKGMLLGARGNSGVILSRIFAGIARGFQGIDAADMAQFAAAMQSGVEESYKAVLTPVEGTILTVWREGVKAAESATDSLESYFKAMLTEMDASLERTPELLAVLKQAGVVDSGGAGLLSIVRGMEAAVNGETIEVSGDSGAEKKQKINLDDFGPDTPLEFGYCTEFLLRLHHSKIEDIDAFDENVIKDYLTSVGESVVCFRDGSIVKAHVHTKTPGQILDHVQQWGEFLTLKIENMTLQHSEATIRDNFHVARKKFASLAVASGEGLVAAFREAGADYVIEGGQTMNPSAKSFIEAFDEINADNVFVFPNNSNIILTAQQAASLYSKSNIIVIPAKTLGAGYVGIASMDYSCGNVDEISAQVCETIDAVITGMVSEAIRNSKQNGIDIKKGYYIGFERNRILACKPTARQTAVKLASKLNVHDHDVALVFYGKDTTEAEAQEVAAELEELYPRTEIMMQSGGQPVYNYIIVLC